MGLVARATGYTDKDLDSLRLRLQSFIRSVFPDWSDFNVANFGNILLELLGPSPVQTLQRNGGVRRVGSWASITGSRSSTRTRPSRHP